MSLKLCWLFCFSELCSIRLCDINFFLLMDLFLGSSKTDQFHDMAWIAIARSNQDTCPVKTLEQYIAAAKIDSGEDMPLFRALSSSRSTSKVRCQGLGYSRAWGIVKDDFKDDFKDAFKDGHNRRFLYKSSHSQGQRSHRCR